jgi:hypothetical protein
MARAVHYEGGEDPADVIWTYTQRYMLPAMRERFATLSALIQAHSQPVNPIWRRDGSKCRPGGAYFGTEHCSESRLARRDEAATMPWADARPEVRMRVEAWARGKLPNPVPRAVDFADPTVARAFLERHPDAVLVKQAGNWFIATAESRQWPPDYVRMGASYALPLLFGVAVLGLLGAWWWRR